MVGGVWYGLVGRRSPNGREIASVLALGAPGGWRARGGALGEAWVPPRRVAGPPRHPRDIVGTSKPLGPPGSHRKGPPHHPVRTPLPTGTVGTGQAPWWATGGSTSHSVLRESSIRSIASTRVALDRIGNLVGLFDCVRRHRSEILLQIPGASALRVSQLCHYLK